MRSWATLERAVELALSVGVGTSALLLMGGLLGQNPLLLRAGVVLLMFTPVARVVVMTAGLFYEGDRRFGAVSLLVLAILAASAAWSWS